MSVQWVKRAPARVQWLGAGSGRLGAVELFQPTKTLDDLVPEVRPKVEALIAYATAHGWSPKIRSVGRTCSGQQEQYDLGYSKADFCRSMHTLGHAIDLDLIPNTCETHTKLGEWWESQGGVWGGRWKQFGACGDMGHYHIGFDKAQAVPTSVCPSGVTYDQCVKVREDYLTKAFAGGVATGAGGSRMGLLSGLLIAGVGAAFVWAAMNVKPGRKLQANHNQLYGRAKREGVTAADVDPEQLRMGTRHELEHTRDRRVARQIALDHLAEDPRYYTHLKKIEPNPKRLGKRRAIEIGQQNASECLDQGVTDAFKSFDDAVGSYNDNVTDTVYEEGGMEASRARKGDALSMRDLAISSFYGYLLRKGAHQDEDGKWHPPR